MSTAIKPSQKNPAEFGRNFGSLIRLGTKIEFSLNQKSLVNLSLYSAMGKKAATLVNTVLTPETYHATIDGIGLSGGLYFLRLQADGATLTERVVLER